MSISKKKLKELIEGVPDENDPDVINYWKDIGGGKLVYLEGWCDECLAGTGFPLMAEGGYEQKLAYIRDMTDIVLSRPEEIKEKGLKLLEGGFVETPDAENLYGVTYGIYDKAESEMGNWL